MSRKGKIILVILLIVLILGIGLYVYAVKKSKSNQEKQLNDAYNYWLKKVAKENSVKQENIIENN